MREYHELTSSQTSMFAAASRKNDTSYNLIECIEIEDKLNISNFKEVINTAINQIDSFKTQFIVKNRQIYQYKNETSNLNLSAISVDTDEEAEELIKLFNTPFKSITENNLVKFMLIQQGSSKFYFVICAHHLIVDGLSLSKFLYGLVDKYYRKKEIETSLSSVYKLYEIKNKKLKLLEKEAEDYWISELQELKMINLPFDKSINRDLSNKAHTLYYSVDSETSRKLIQDAKKNNVTLFEYLLTAFNIMIARISGQRDIVVGIPLSGRNIRKAREAIGMFVNTLPMRYQYNGNSTLKEALNLTHKKIIQMNQYQDCSFERILNKLKLKKEKNRELLFDVLFSFYDENFSSSYYNIKRKEIPNDLAQFFITMNVMVDHNKNIMLKLEYFKELFDEQVMFLLLKRFEYILVSASSEKSLDQLDTISLEEKEIVTTKFNNTDSLYNQAESLVRRIDKLSLLTPDKVALIFKGKSITFSELKEKKKKYIDILNQNNVNVQQVVGIQADRSPDMVAAILAIWEIGAIYVPIDKTAPVERIKYIINVTKMKLVFKDKIENEDILVAKQLNKVTDDKDKKASSTNYKYSPDDLAYIIFTSGSTGTPKGAMVTHLGMTNHLLSKKKLLSLDNSSVIMQNATHVFDISIWQFFSALSVGGTTVIATEVENKNISLFLELVTKEKVNILEVVPSYLQLFVNRFKKINELYPSLNNLLVTGEKIDRQLVQDWFSTNQSQHTKIINAYGPTEASDDITHYIIKPGDYFEEIPIGKPINNMKIYILDKENHICGLDMEGEICVTGLGVGKGYIGDKEKTKAAFVHNPYGKGMMYRTGDLGSWRKDGVVRYLGRKDDQIKIRGYRIELGEIENCLKLHSEIKNAVVLKNDRNELTAYVSFFNKEVNLENTELPSYLKNYLPSYMIPNYFVKVENFPLSNNGKIDRSRLKNMRVISAKKKIAPPVTHTEKKLFEIWSDVLEIDNFGIDDLFIDLYGNSIKAIYMADLIQEQFGVEIGIENILSLDTIKKQAEYIDARNSKYIDQQPIHKQERKFTLVSSAQRRVYLATNLFRNSITYNMPALFLVNKKLTVDELNFIFSKIIQNHPNLRTNFIMKDDNIYQWVHRNVAEINFAVKDVVEDNLSERALIKKYTKPFDLELDCLLRVILIQSRRKQYLFIDLSHIISDGISLQILIKEFCELYNNQSISKEILTYQEFLSSNDSNSTTYLQKKDYWLSQFKNNGKIVGIPYDKQPNVKSEEGSTERLILDNHYLSKIREFSKNYSVSYQTIFLSVYYILLFKYTGESDITIGTVSMGRKKYGYRNTLGMFVNTLPIKIDLAQFSSFLDLVKKVKKVSSKAIDNEEYQYDTLLEDLHQSPRLNGLFSSLFIFQDNYIDNINAGSLNLKLINHDQITAKFDTEYQIFVNKNKLILELSYLTCLYDSQTIQLVLKYYKVLLDQIIVEREFNIPNLSLLSREQKKEISLKKLDYKKQTSGSLIALFKKSVAQYPDKIAVVEGEQAISYQMLDAVSDRLATQIQHSLGKNIYSIGIEMGNTITMIVSILAVLKLGAMYIPIDSKLPFDRRTEMLESGQAVCLLTDTKKIYKDIMVKVIDWRDFVEVTESNYIAPDLVGETGACIVYTSGTTGKPKGNVVEHQNIMRIIDNPNFVRIPSNHVMLQPSNFSFDGSFFNIFGSICNGGTLVLCEIKRLLDLSYIENLIRTKNVTHFFVTTSLFNVWVENIADAMSNIDYILIGGESASTKHCQLLFESSFSGTLINGYGPTESVFFATTYPMTKKTDVVDPIPIGRPISKTSVYLINKNNDLLPAGIKGEIAIGGSGLIREYIGDPSLYKERFISLDGEKVYLTGDRGLLNQEGQLEFLGRKDNQVKYNGYRIELNEIESTLDKYAGIQQSVVIYIQQYKTIFAFILINDRYKGLHELQKYLCDNLPFYMLPSKIEILSEFPLNKNGKVDRAKLRKRIKRDRTVLNEKIKYNNPLLEVSAKVLNLGRLEEKDSFYEKGGDSIKAIQISAELLKRGYELQANDILTSSNFKELSKQMKNISSMGNKSYSGPVNLLPNHKQYLQANKDIHHFLQSILLETKSAIDRQAVKQAIEIVLQSHDMLRSTYSDNQIICKSQKELPYNLFEFDFSEDSLKNAEKKIQEELQVLKKSTNLKEGPVFFASIFKTSKKEYLLLCCHHFMVDSISWRIILGDFFQQYFSKNTSIYNSLVRTSSFKDWVDTLEEYTQTELYKKRKKEWEQIEKVKTKSNKRVQNKKKQRQTFTINRSITNDLLNKANHPYTTDTNILLITALTESINNWRATFSPYKIILEGHGREPISRSVNISRTVGWFTTIYPFLVNKEFQDLGVSIKWVKEQLNRIPNKGLDYGLFRFSSPKINRKINEGKELISFNFLGDLDSGFEVEDFSLSKIPNVGDQGEEIELLAFIEITAMIVNGQLILEFTYDEGNYSYEDIHYLGKIMTKKISNVVSYCLSKKSVEKTPSDFSDPSLVEEDLKKLNDLFN